MLTLKKSLVVLQHKHTALLFLCVYIRHTFDCKSLIPYPEPVKRTQRNQAWSLNPLAPSYIVIFISVTKYGTSMTLPGGQNTRVT
jgi:hypothetical protein